MNTTTISWVRGPDGAAGFSWNPFAGCSPEKPTLGCAHCYAERLAATRLAHLPAYAGLANSVPLHDTRGRIWTHEARWSGSVRFFPDKLSEPLRRRKPAGVFVGDMGDIALLPNEQIAAIFGVMAACQQHRFYILTKRPERLREWFGWASECGARGARSACRVSASGYIGQMVETEPFGSAWPSPNAFIGASASTQADLDRVAPELLRIPAAVRFISYEPALEKPRFDPGLLGCKGHLAESFGNPLIHWIIAGGESGPNARPCHVAWLRSIVRQCRAAGTACWVKQAGSNCQVGCHDNLSDWPRLPTVYAADVPVGSMWRLKLRDRSGSDMSEWPEDLRVREIPEVTT